MFSLIKKKEDEISNDNTRQSIKNDCERCKLLWK